jgi:hypothetical protein
MLFCWQLDIDVIFMSQNINIFRKISMYKITIECDTPEELLELSKALVAAKKDKVLKDGTVFEFISWEGWYLYDCINVMGTVTSDGKWKEMHDMDLLKYRNNGRSPFKTLKSISARVGGAKKVALRLNLPLIFKSSQRQKKRYYAIRIIEEEIFKKAIVKFGGDYENWLEEENFKRP